MGEGQEPEGKMFPPYRGDKGGLVQYSGGYSDGVHLFPYRTEKLSPSAPMVLRKWESRSPPILNESLGRDPEAFFVSANYAKTANFCESFGSTEIVVDL